MNPDTYCVMVTNGELLDRFSLTDMIQSNLDSMVISINAFSKEMYERINNGLNYERVMKNVSYLLSNQSMRQKIKLSFVVTDRNVHEVCQAARYWKTQGVKTRVMGITNRAGSLENYEKVKFKGNYYGNPLPLRLWRWLMSKARAATGCELPFYHMNILFNGDAIICCHDWNRSLVVGNARTSSLREIWNSEKINIVRRLILRKRYEQIASCKECSFVK